MSSPSRSHTDTPGFTAWGLLLEDLRAAGESSDPSLLQPHQARIIVRQYGDLVMVANQRLADLQRLEIALNEIALWPFDVNETDESDLGAIKAHALAALREDSGV